MSPSEEQPLEPPLEPQPAVTPPGPPAPDEPIVDLAALAFMIGLLVLGVAMMLAMVHR